MNHKKKLLLFEILLILIIIVFFLFILKSNNYKQNNKTQDNNSQIANPASVNCVNNNGTLKILRNDYGEYGVCYFKDGSSCEEWAYYRKKCVPGQNKTQDNNSQLANPASVNCIDNNGTLKIMNDGNGEYGVCYFKDGSSCEEWAYYRKECVPGQNK